MFENPSDFEFSKKGKRIISSFIGEGLLHDYLSNKIDSERKEYLEQSFKKNKDLNLQILKFQKATNYLNNLKELKVEDFVIQEIKIPSSYFQVLLQKIKFHQWPLGIKLGLEGLFVAFCMIVFIMAIPWHNLLQLKWESAQQVTLSQIQKNKSNLDHEGKTLFSHQDDLPQFEDEGVNPSSVASSNLKKKESSTSTNIVGYQEKTNHEIEKKNQEKVFAENILNSTAKALLAGVGTENLEVISKKENSNIQIEKSIENQKLSKNLATTELPFSAPDPINTENSLSLNKKENLAANSINRDDLLQTNKQIVSTKSQENIEINKTKNTELIEQIDSTEGSSESNTGQGVGAKKGILYRGYVFVSNVPATTQKFIENITQMGGRKAGEVPLGWKKGKGSYFHFTIPENKYSLVLNFFSEYGSVIVQKEHHDRTMPEGIIRLIIIVEEKKNDRIFKKSLLKSAPVKKISSPASQEDPSLDSDSNVDLKPNSNPKPNLNPNGEVDSTEKSKPKGIE